MDKMACGLVDTRNSDEAWRAIFIKPPLKSWSDTEPALGSKRWIRENHDDPLLCECELLPKSSIESIVLPTLSMSITEI